MSEKKSSTNKSKNHTTDEDMKEISETYGGSPVTSDATGDAGDTQEVDLSKATITVPRDAVKFSDADSINHLDDAQAEKELEAIERTEQQRAADASIGLIRVDGGGFNYVGLAPALDKTAELPDGRKVSSFNSTFTPLSEVRFDISVRCKDPKSGEYYFPTEATSWDTAELNGSPLIPKEPNKKAASYRKSAAK